MRMFSDILIFMVIRRIETDGRRSRLCGFPALQKGAASLGGRTAVTV